MIVHSIHCDAVNRMIQNDPMTNTDIVQLVARKDYDSYMAYSILYEGLSQLLYTKNLAVLPVIANRIRVVKHNL